MEKPSGYGPDIAGSNPAGSTIYRLAAWKDELGENKWV